MRIDVRELPILKAHSICDDPYELSDALMDEMLDAMVELVENSDLRPAKKEAVYEVL